MSDRVIYVVTTKGGGIDGRDHTDKPSDKFASFNKEEAQGEVTSWDQPVRMEAVNSDMIFEDIMGSLDPIQKAVMHDYIRSLVHG